MADLSRFLESTRDPRSHSIRCSLRAPDRADTDFFSGAALAALTTLSFSENVDLQRMAAVAFVEITERGVRHVEHKALNPILHLLDSCDTSVQEAACVALKNFAIDSGYFSVLA